ncbi:hypothetical protein [Nitrosomonas sp. Is37]|uniref:hypothetical protein n=1 Tax=Nitrosomonas sp. Is37 TaxID=3080535 RepID=UPI00294AD75D|nr:hypothetical protein [Nitrosomonas sp. Is37]
MSRSPAITPGTRISHAKQRPIVVSAELFLNIIPKSDDGEHGRGEPAETTRNCPG